MILSQLAGTIAVNAEPMMILPQAMSSIVVIELMNALKPWVINPFVSFHFTLFPFNIELI